MLGEAALTAADAAALPRRPTSTRSTPSARPAAGSGVYAGPGISVKLSALHPRYERAQHARVMAELLPRLQDARCCWPRRLRHRPQHRRRGGRPARAVARPDRGAGAPTRARRLGRPRPRRPGLPEALPVRARLADRPRPAHRPPLHGAPGQGRLLGQRDQARPGATAWPATRSSPARSTPTSPTSPAPGSCWRRSDAHLPAVRHPQRPHARRGPRARPAARTASSSACTAWARRSTTRSSGRGHAGPPLPRLRPGRHPRDPARLPGAPPARERRQHLLRQPAGRPAVSVDELVADQVAMAERHGGRRPTAASRCRATSTPRSARTRKASTSPSEHDLRWLDDGLAAAAPGPPRPILAGRAYDPGNGAAGPQPRRPCRPASAPCARPTSDEVAARPGRRRRAPPRAGPPPRSPSAPPASSAPPTCSRRRCRELIGARRSARPARRCPTPSPRCARRSISAATTPPASAPSSTTAPTRALGPVVCIAPWNFPLAIFTGQVAAALAAGNTVLAKPAEQTPLIAAAAVRLFHRAGVPADVLQLLPGDGATVGAALVADPRVAGRGLHRLDRGGAR